MSTVVLRDLPSRCFDGAIPNILSTCSADGVPNATWLSQVFFVDERHVALSCQFFRKTRANLEAHPFAQLLLVDPTTVAQWTIDLRFERRETSGATFDAMKLRLDAIASHTGMEDVFALQSADIFEVLEIDPVVVEVPRDVAATAPSMDALAALARLTESIAGCSDVGSLVESGLGALGAHLGYEGVSLYVFEESEGMLYALASRGFTHSGVGASVALGASVIGSCAQHRMAIRIGDASRERRYGRAVREQSARVHGREEREIPLPGLDGAKSLLAVPIVMGGKVFGVLAVESSRVSAFDQRDEQLLGTAGHMIAQGIALHRDDDADREGDEGTDPSGASKAVVRVRYYEADDSVFVDGEYLIKGLPGRILWLVLTLRSTEGRSTFSNRELRLHPFLKLPSYKDNLETRLLMLQRRLDEKGVAFRLLREQRGRLQLACDARLELEKI
jgi:putative methionine-R-sulfoxide reductase with GAF domain